MPTAKKRGGQVKHGLSHSKTWNSWRHMMRRCYEPCSASYWNYGARGIEVCKEWHTFIGFLADMGERPVGMTLDRIDGTKGYSKDNCRWATKEQQMRNTRRNRLVTVDGVSMTATEAATKYGLSPFTVFDRVRRGLTDERAVMPPRGKNNANA